MGFKEDVQNYKSLKSDIYHTDTAPGDIWGKLEAYANKVFINEEGRPKVLTNRLNDLALLPPTTNWSGDFLVYDLQNAIYTIKKQVEQGEFYLLMDAIAIIVGEAHIDLDEINEFLEKEKIGYELVQQGYAGDFRWYPLEDLESITESIEQTQELVKDEFEQAIEHFVQARKPLENKENERARKDAVRDCASAMESIIKILGQEDDIKKASKNLRDEKKWGKVDIVKDGDAIFNKLHYLYPDLRHGSTDKSTMTLEEAQYWVERITTYIDYMIRRKKSLNI